MGLPNKALGCTGLILLHDQVEVGVVPLSSGDVPLSLHRLLVSMDGMLMSRQGTDMIRASRAVPTAGSNVSLRVLSQSSLGASVFFAGSFCMPLCSLGHLVHFLGILLCATKVSLPLLVVSGGPQAGRALSSLARLSALCSQWKVQVDSR